VSEPLPASTQPMSESSKPSNTILEHQRPAFDRLRAVGRAAFSIHRSVLPIHLRTNTLMVGPSGTGKTFLAKAVADALRVPFLPLSVSDWILMGCTQRGAVTTWPRIVNFLRENECTDGAVIFIDEIDKLASDCPWTTFLRTEIFQLLDGSVPSGLCDSDGDALTPGDLRVARNRLSRQTFIIAAGAFQTLWEAEGRAPIGFSGFEPPNTPVNLNRLTTLLPRELVNRFRAEVITLPRLSKNDYISMALRAAELMPAYLQDVYLRLSGERVDAAAANQQGCRFLEEALLDSLIERLRLGEDEQADASRSEPSL
jgi:hypothetical protein